MIQPMPRESDTYARELRVALRLAREAGAAAMRFYRTTNLEINFKGADKKEPVTEADFAANSIIVAGLRNEFPGDGLLSEETIDTTERLTKRRVWMIDPLDGTQGFIDRNDDFAVQIGLAVDGTAHLGAVYQPARDLMHFASQGGGSWMQKGDEEPRRLHVSNETAMNRLRLAASRSHRSPRMSRIISELGLKSEVRRGSVGVKVGLIVECECDLYVHLSPRTKHWDTCAPEAILREAGGRMTDLFGAAFRYNTPDVQNHNGVVSTNGAAHQNIIARLAPILREFGRTPI